MPPNGTLDINTLESWLWEAACKIRGKTHKRTGIWGWRVNELKSLSLEHGLLEKFTSK